MAWTTPMTYTSGAVLTAAQMNTYVRDNMLELAPFSAVWTSWTPSLTASTTDPTLGTGSTTSGTYLKVGRLVVARFLIGFGSSGVSAGSGTYRLSLPVTARSADNRIFTGVARVNDSDVGQVGFVYIRQGATTYVEFQYTTALPLSVAVNVANNAPMTWAANDTLTGQFIYEAAS